MTQGIRRRGRPRLDAAAIRIRCAITRDTHPVLYDALLKVRGRKRQERLRNLAQLGVMVEAGAFRLAPEASHEPAAPTQGKPRSRTIRGDSAPAKIGDDFIGFDLWTSERD